MTTGTSLTKLPHQLCFRLTSDNFSFTQDNFCQKYFPFVHVTQPRPRYKSPVPSKNKILLPIKLHKHTIPLTKLLTFFFFRTITPFRVNRLQFRDSTTFPTLGYVSSPLLPTVFVKSVTLSSLPSHIPMSTSIQPSKPSSTYIFNKRRTMINHFIRSDS